MKKSYFLIVYLWASSCAFASEFESPIKWLSDVEDLNGWKPSFSNVAELESAVNTSRKNFSWTCAGLEKWLVFAELEFRDNKWFLNYLVVPKSGEDKESAKNFSSPCKVSFVKKGGGRIRYFHSEKSLVSLEFLKMKAGAKHKNKITGSDYETIQETGLNGWQVELGELKLEDVTGVLVDFSITEHKQKQMNTIEPLPASIVSLFLSMK